MKSQISKAFPKQDDNMRNQLQSRGSQSSFQKRNFQFQIKDLQRDLTEKYVKKFAKEKTMNILYIEKIIRDFCKKLIQRQTLEINKHDVKQIEEKIHIYSNLQRPFMMKREDFSDTDSTITFNTLSSFQSRQTQSRQSAQSRQSVGGGDQLSNISQSDLPNRDNWTAFSKRKTVGQTLANLTYKSQLEKQKKAREQDLNNQALQKSPKSDRIRHKTMTNTPKAGQYGSRPDSVMQQERLKTDSNYVSLTSSQGSYSRGQKKRPKKNYYNTKSSISVMQNLHPKYVDQLKGEKIRQLQSSGGFNSYSSWQQTLQSQNSQSSSFQPKFRKYRKDPSFGPKKSDEILDKEKQEAKEMIDEIVKTSPKCLIPGIQFDQTWKDDLISVSDSNAADQELNFGTGYMRQKEQDITWDNQIRLDSHLFDKENKRRLKNKKIQQQKIKEELDQQVNQRKIRSTQQSEEDSNFITVQKKILQTQEEAAGETEKQKEQAKKQYQQDLKIQLKENKKKKRDQEKVLQKENEYYKVAYQREIDEEEQFEKEQRETRQQFMRNVLQESLEEIAAKQAQEKLDLQRENEQINEFYRIKNDMEDQKEAKMQKRKDDYQKFIRRSFNHRDSQFPSRLQELRNNEKMKEFQETNAQKEMEEDRQRFLEKKQMEKENQEYLRNQIAEKLQRSSYDKELDKKQAAVWKQDYLRSLQEDEQVRLRKTENQFRNLQELRKQILDKNMEKLINLSKPKTVQELYKQKMMLETARITDPTLSQTNVSGFKLSKQKNIT